ncbi:Re/Si-specific NAD(P)(+) transhydrogenase subunit alpha [candidate division KSB1 bacterium]|nr:Re/Si-specific NAD(P)(+) transhydrogenase subunit alpha [candidate division KSB1 bacterium]NIR68592.1 Re/Si-specific NAD(P)(+) transhydrogenase subunit alpha [candidate division KSB1 bacterium]NIS25429.1 Re/Si-specific NAD(P)(+) transhydrogenase subunit alpha [candidate division KSB1 bacterium]NIT72321.1 Re/Si-specific NAD(P)(+) transhydrogenase subunit alpha [candidate division KSB1 bacterium]NIU26105.1 Re/Si-specific NAD(P)(+) transhydrogenase subunit alpha [candidate division KSB1 bacteri
MKIGIPKEIMEGETRVSVIPSMVPVLKKDGHEVLVESGAGVKASFSDEQYKEAGAEIVKGAADLYRTAEVVIKFQAPQKNTSLKKHEVDLMKEGSTLFSSLPPVTLPTVIQHLLDRKITSFGMEYIPRITKAQSMDVLSSMSTVAGYKAVLVAAYHLGKFFPLLMTAAGTIPPVTVLVLGAGVAGLQAIATAKRLGAKVEAFDPRPAVREQVESLGARFVEMELPEDVETTGGYAKEQSEEFLQKEREAIAARLPKVDAVITTAQVFGKESPLLITEDMVKTMQRGSVIVDLAVAEGGNCELSKSNEPVEKYGVTVFGAVNIARQLPVHASQMHSKNVTTLFKHIFQDTESNLDFEDEITKSTCVTHNGEIVNEMVRKFIEEEK